MKNQIGCPRLLNCEQNDKFHQIYLRVRPRRIKQPPLRCHNAREIPKRTHREVVLTNYQIHS